MSQDDDIGDNHDEDDEASDKQRNGVVSLDGRYDRLREVSSHG
jgi:hypothetical protein